MSAAANSRTLLVVSYEFTYSPFSGNGVLARSLVNGLLGCGCRVLVVCARPADVQCVPASFLSGLANF